MNLDEIKSETVEHVKVEGEKRTITHEENEQPIRRVRRNETTITREIVPTIENLKLENANGSDCFLISSINVLRSAATFFENLKEIIFNIYNGETNGAQLISEISIVYRQPQIIRNVL
jgi:hypothetical protein